MIKPTVGRIVWLYQKDVEGHQGPRAAIITSVRDDQLIGVCAFSESGIPYAQCPIVLFQGEGKKPDTDYCTWMPFQIGQAARTEAAEKKLAEKV